MIINPKEELFLWKVEAVPFFSYSAMNGMSVLSKRRWEFYWPDSNFIIINNGKEGFWYSQMSDVYNQGIKSYQTLFENENKRSHFRKIYQKDVDDLLEFSGNINKEVLAKLSDNELNENFQNLVKKYQIFWSVGIVPELAAYGSANLLENEVKKYFNEFDAQRIIRILSSPTEFSFHMKEQLSILEIGSDIWQIPALKNLLIKRDIKNLIKEIKRNHPGIYQRLRTHQRNFHWVLNGYWGARELDIHHFLNELTDLVNSQLNPQKIIEKIINDKEKSESEKNQIIKKFELSEKLVLLGIGTGVATSWQDERKAVALITSYYLDLFLNEFSKRQCLSKDDLKFLIPKEIIELEKNKIVLKKIPSRKIACTIEFDDNIVNLIEKKQSLKVLQILENTKQDHIESVKKVKGLVVSVSQRIVQGKVRILKNASEAGKLKSDEILVTVMTSPEYIQAIKRAKAIITDEGGLTCHAAIVSRELGKTCIVSTKIATKVLKDGDRVEVDANKGIIKKLT